MRNPADLDAEFALARRLGATDGVRTVRIFAFPLALSSFLFFWVFFLFFLVGVEY